MHWRLTPKSTFIKRYCIRVNLNCCAAQRTKVITIYVATLADDWRKLFQCECDFGKYNNLFIRANA